MPIWDNQETMITFNNIYSTIVVDEKLRSTRSSHAMPAHQSVLFSEALFLVKSDQKQYHRHQPHWCGWCDNCLWSRHIYIYIVKLVPYILWAWSSPQLLSSSILFSFEHSPFSLLVARESNRDTRVRYLGILFPYNIYFPSFSLNTKIFHHTNSLTL